MVVNVVKGRERFSVCFSAKFMSREWCVHAYAAFTIVLMVYKRPAHDAATDCSDIQQQQGWTEKVSSR